MKFIGKFIVCLLVAAVASSLFSNPQFQSYGFAAFAIACTLSIIITDLNISLPSSNPFASPKEQGEVKWFNVNKGFGFITRDQGDDIFVHFRSIRGKGRRSLREGQKVEFKVVDSDKGLQAEDVNALES